MTDEPTERGAAEESSGSPLTPSETEASQTPPSRSSSDAGEQPGEHDEADSANNTDV